jgi:hypothetical protein
MCSSYFIWLLEGSTFLHVVLQGLKVQTCYNTSNTSLKDHLFKKYLSCTACVLELGNVL